MTLALGPLAPLHIEGATPLWESVLWWGLVVVIWAVLFVAGNRMTR